MKPEHKKYIIIGSAILLVGAIILFAKSKKVSSQSITPPGDLSQTTTTGTTSKNTSPVLITNFDSVWDYKLENGVWYTKKKTDANWSKMKDIATNYDLAVSKLTAFMNKK